MPVPCALSSLDLLHWIMSTNHCFILHAIFHMVNDYHKNLFIQVHIIKYLLRKIYYHVIKILEFLFRLILAMGSTVIISLQISLINLLCGLKLGLAGNFHLNYWFMSTCFEFFFLVRMNQSTNIFLIYSALIHPIHNIYQVHCFWRSSSSPASWGFGFCCCKVYTERRILC